MRNATNTDLYLVKGLPFNLKMWYWLPGSRTWHYSRWNRKSTKHRTWHGNSPSRFADMLA